MTRTHASEYKVLSFGTTVRNPERFKAFLSVLYEYNNRILTNDVIYEVVHDFIRNGIYTPQYVQRNDKLKEKIRTNTISNKEINDIIENSPQRHKEAGFDKGWASRFDTWYRLVKELGFVYYEIGKSIEFSEAGKILVPSEDKAHETTQTESSVFLNAFVKYRRNNPFRRILNSNSPLILLLETIKKLNNDDDFNGNGISRKEIPILLCWRDDDANALYRTIKEVRSKYGYAPSSEVIFDICNDLIDGRTSSNQRTILVEYPDDFIRKMKLTGLISIRGMGRFIDINKNERPKINYVLEKYKNISFPKEERGYFDFVSQIDNKLIELEHQPLTQNATFEGLKLWANKYEWDTIKKELNSLAKTESRSSDKVLKYISNPLRLEFLTSLAIVKKYPNYIVNPNYIIDDEGLPSSHAPGNKADIECVKDNSAILIEVTLLNGTAQTKNESFPVIRHLRSYKDVSGKSTFVIFIAPKIFEDTISHFEWALDIKGHDVRPVEIETFTEHCDKNHELEKIKADY